MQFEDYDGNLVTVEYPKAKDLMQFTHDANQIAFGKSEMNEYELAKNFLVSCKFDEKLVQELYYDDMLEIIEDLKGINEKKS